MDDKLLFPKDTSPMTGSRVLYYDIDNQRYMVRRGPPLDYTPKFSTPEPDDPITPMP